MVVACLLSIDIELLIDCQIGCTVVIDSSSHTCGKHSGGTPPSLDNATQSGEYCDIGHGACDSVQITERIG
jgi:hypothetical protein